jgi:hypothetical protein
VTKARAIALRARLDTHPESPFDASDSIKESVSLCEN